MWHVLFYPKILLFSPLLKYFLCKNIDFFLVSMEKHSLKGVKKYFNGVKLFFTVFITGSDLEMFSGNKIFLYYLYY